MFVCGVRHLVFVMDYTRVCRRLWVIPAIIVSWLYLLPWKSIKTLREKALVTVHHFLYCCWMQPYICSAVFFFTFRNWKWNTISCRNDRVKVKDTLSNQVTVGFLQLDCFWIIQKILFSVLFVSNQLFTSACQCLHTERVLLWQQCCKMKAFKFPQLRSWLLVKFRSSRACEENYALSALLSVHMLCHTRTAHEHIQSQQVQHTAIHFELSAAIKRL